MIFNSNSPCELVRCSSTVHLLIRCVCADRDRVFKYIILQQPHFSGYKVMNYSVG